MTKKSVRQSCQREADRQREKKRQKEIRETQERLAAMGGGFWELLVGSGYVDDMAKLADEEEQREQAAMQLAESMNFGVVGMVPSVSASHSGNREVASSSLETDGAIPEDGSGSGSDAENSTGAGALRDQMVTDDDASETVVGDDVVEEGDLQPEEATPMGVVAALIADGGVDHTQNLQHQGPHTVEEWNEVWQRAAEN
jgi:hypothetical protein